MRPLLCLLLGLLGACGGDGETAPPAGDSLAALQPLRERALAGSEVVSTLTPDPENLWKVRGAQEVEAVEPPFHPGGPLVLRARGAKRMDFDIRGVFDTSTFDRVEVELLSRLRCKVSLQVLRKGEVIAQSSVSLKDGVNVPEVLEFPLMWEADSLPADLLRVRVQGGEGLIFLHGLRLVSAPIDYGFPRAETGPELSFVEGDGRRAIALDAKTPHTLSIPQPTGSVLEFEVGLPIGREPRSGAPNLVIAAKGEARKPVIRRFPARAGIWRNFEFDLTPLGDEPCQLTFTLESAGDAMLLVGDLHVRRSIERSAPLVLLVSSDTHRADHLGCAGEVEPLYTPVLDALAARGVRYELAFAGANITLPSHTALLTGLHPKDSGVLNNATLLTESADTLAERFQAAGWATYGVVSSRHLSASISGFGQGFDRYAQTNRATRVARGAVETLMRWLERHPDRPTFAFLHLFDAHGPYQPPAEYSRQQLKSLGERAGLVRRQKALYRAEIDYLDNALKPLMNSARVQGGIVAFTADHGEVLQAHGISFAHPLVYPDTTRVPLLLSWPGAPAGTVASTPVRQLDVGRTLLELAGVEAQGFPGRSLAEVVAGTPQEPQPIFSLSAGAESASVYAKGWYLILHLEEHTPLGGVRPRTYFRHEVELFHLDEDPGALQDLASEEHDRVRGLRRLLTDWLNQEPVGRVSQAVELTDQAREALAQMGYAGADLETVGDIGFDLDCDCDRCRAIETAGQ